MMCADINKETKIALNGYASYLRDVADKDYISAREMYWLGFMENFLWFSLQAVEKYLKAILLYNGLKAKTYGHETVRPILFIEEKTAIRFGFSGSENSLVRRLNAYGHDRYDIIGKYNKPEDLFDLDWVVWKIRRFCQNFSWAPEGKDLSGKLLANVMNDDHLSAPQRFKLSDGFLEGLVDSSRKDCQYQWSRLVYKNPTYGRRAKKKIKKYKLMFKVRFPNARQLDLIKDYIKLPKTIDGNQKSKGENPK